MEIIKFLNKLNRIFLVSFQSQNADRAKTFIWTLEGFFSAFVPAAAWIFLSFGESSTKIDIDKLIVYYFVLFVLWVITAGNIGWSIARDIKSGRLTAALLQPIHPLWQNILNEQAWKVVSATFTVPIFFIVIFMMHKESILIDALPNLPYFLITLIIGAILWIETELMMGLSAFWLTKIDGIYTASYVINGLWGARIAPMTLLPLFIQQTAYYLPFRFYFSFPADTLLNPIVLDDFVKSTILCIIWILILGVMLKLIYKFGLKKYEAIGI
jgi:ABC-2 type transport system permease protein